MNFYKHKINNNEFREVFIFKVATSLSINTKNFKNMCFLLKKIGVQYY